MGVCRLCLGTITKGSHISNPIVKDALQLFIPEMNHSLVTQAVICQKCFNHLNAASSFLRHKIQSDETILEEMQKCTLSKVDLRKTFYGNKNISSPDFLDVCRICLKRIEKDGRICLYKTSADELEYEMIENMFEVCSIDVNLKISHKPVMCIDCWELLQRVYAFKSDFIAVEQKIRGYFRFVNKYKPLSPVHLEQLVKHLSENTRDPFLGRRQGLRRLSKYSTASQNTDCEHFEDKTIGENAPSVPETVPETNTSHVAIIHNKVSVVVSLKRKPAVFESCDPVVEKDVDHPKRRRTIPQVYNLEELCNSQHQNLVSESLDKKDKLLRGISSSSSISTNIPAIKPVTEMKQLEQTQNNESPPKKGQPRELRCNLIRLDVSLIQKAISAVAPHHESDTDSASEDDNNRYVTMDHDSESDDVFDEDEDRKVPMGSIDASAIKKEQEISNESRVETAPLDVEIVEKESEKPDAPEDTSTNKGSTSEETKGSNSNNSNKETRLPADVKIQRKKKSSVIKMSTSKKSTASTLRRNQKPRDPYEEMQTTEHNAVTSTSILKEHSYSIVSYEIENVAVNSSHLLKVYWEVTKHGTEFNVGCFNELQKQWHELYSCNIPGEHLSNYAYYLLSNSLLLPYAVREEFLSAHHVLKRYCTTKNKSLAKETYTKILKLYLRVTHNETLFGHNYLKELQSLWSCFFPKPLGPMRGEQIVIAARYIISANLLPNEEIEKIRSEYVCLAGNESENERGTSEVTTAQNKQVELVINTETAVAGTKVVDNKSPIKIALDTDTVEGETSSVPVVDSSSHQSNVTTFVQTQTNAENLAKNGMKTEADENELPSLVIAMDHHPSHSSTAETCAINGTISENVNNNKSVVQSRKGIVGAVKKKSRFRLTRKKGWTKTRKQMPLIQKVSGEVNDKSSEIRNAVANEITTMLIEKTGHGSKLEQELWDDSVFHTTFIRPRKSTTCKPIGKEVTELPCKDVRLGHPNPKEQIREESSVAPVPDIITENLPVDGVEEEVVNYTIEIDVSKFDDLPNGYYIFNNVPDLENEDGTHNQIVAVLDYYPLESEPAILESCGINTRELSQEVTSNVNQCTIGNDKVVAATDKQISISQSAKAPTAQEKPLPGFSQSESDKCATLTRTTTELAEVRSSSCQSNLNEQDAILTEQSAELRVSGVQKYKFKKIHQSSTTGRAKRITYYDERNRKYIEKNSDFGDLSEEEYDLSKPPTTCPTIKESIKNVELVTIYVDSILNGGASTHEICSQILEHRYLEIFGHKKSGQYLINRVNYVLKHKRLPLKTLTAIWDTTRVRNKIRNVVLKLENISIPTGVKIELINRVIVEAPGCTILHHKIKKHNELKQRLGGDHRSPSKASTVSVNDSGYTNTNPRETSDGVIAVPPDAENDFVDIVLSVKHPSLSQTNIYKVITEVWERNKKQAIAVPQSQINVSKTEPKVEDASSSRNNTEIREEHKNVDVSVPPLFYSPCNTHNVTRGITESVPNTIISNASTREFLFETPSKEIVKDANIIEPVKYTSRIPVEAITIHDEIRNKSPTNKSKDVNKSIVELITNVPEDEVVNNSETENSSRLELSIANSPDKPNLKINEIVSGDNSRFSTTNPKDVDKPVIFPKEIPGLRKDVVDVVNKSEMEESACLQLSSACSPNKPKPKINETVVGNESQSSTNQTKDADKPLVLPRKVRELRKSVVDDFEVINKSEIGKSSQLQLGSASSPNLIINNALDRNRSQCSTNNRKDVGKPITLPRKVRELRRSVVDEVEVVNKSEIGKSSQLQLSSASSSNMPNPKINKVVGGNESQSSANNSSGVLPSKVRKLRKNVVDGVGKINKSEMGNSCKLQQDSASSPNIPNSKTSEAAGINKAQYSTNNLKDVDQPIILPRTEVRKNVVDEVKVVNKCEMGKSSELQPDNTNSLSKAIPKISESVGRNKSQSSIDNPKDLKESMILPIKIRRIRKNLFEVEVVNKSEIEKSSQLQLDSVTSPDKPNLEVPKKKKLRRRSKSVALTKASLLKDNEVDEASNSPVKATTTNKELEIGNDCPSLVPINDISNSSLAAKKSLQKASIKKLSKPVPVVQSLVNNVCKRKRKSAEAHENKIDVTDRLQTPAVAKKLSKPVPVVQTSVNNVCKRKRKSAEAHENKIDVTDRLQTPAVAKPLLWILEPPPLIPISNKWKPEVSRFEPKWKTVTSTVTNVNSDDIAKEITGITVSPCTMGPLKNVQASDDVVDCGEKFITALSNSVASKANESDLEIVDINNTRKDEIEPIKTNDKAASGIVIKKNERKKRSGFRSSARKIGKRVSAQTSLGDGCQSPNPLAVDNSSSQSKSSASSSCAAKAAELQISMEKPSKVSIIGAKNDLNSATSTCSSTTETTNKEAAVVLNEIEKANQQQNPVTNDSTKPSQDNVPKKGNEYLKQMFVTTNYFIENRASSSSAPFGSKADSDTLVLPTGSAANEEMSEDGFTNLQLEKIVRPRVYFLLKASVGDPHTPNRRPRQLSEWTLSEAQFNELIEPRWPMKHILGPIVLKAEDTIKIDCFYKCAKCSYQTSVYNTLKSHIQNHITTDLLKRIFRCTLCSFMSFQLSELEQHMRCAHDKPMKRKHSLGHRKWGSGDCSFCTFGKHV